MKYLIGQKVIYQNERICLIQDDAVKREKNKKNRIWIKDYMEGFELYVDPCNVKPLNTKNLSLNDQIKTGKELTEIIETVEFENCYNCEHAINHGSDLFGNCWECTIGHNPDVALDAGITVDYQCAGFKPEET